MAGNDWPSVGFTLVGNARMRNIRDCITSLYQENVPGDFTESGVWRGGACIWARQLFDGAGQTARHVHVFDIFGDMQKYGPAMKFISISEERVRQNFRNFDANFLSTHFHVGLIKDTLPNFDWQYKGLLDFLRNDGNYYDSYQDALCYLYSKVPVGEFIIFDDVFTHEVVMQAWQDFKKDFGLPEVDRHSGVFKKTIDRLVDFSKMRDPSLSSSEYLNVAVEDKGVPHS